MGCYFNFNPIPHVCSLICHVTRTCQGCVFSKHVAVWKTVLVNRPVFRLPRTHALQACLSCAGISVVAMTLIVDSRAHFEKRCNDRGMSGRALQQLLGSNLDTMGKLAFSVGQPGQRLNQAEFDTYAQNTLGAMINQSDSAILKRLIFEGHTLVLGQLREMVSDPNAAATRKLPAVEREHRLTQLRGRLAGVIVERQLEPSHELLEAVMQQKEMNQLNYISLERCSSRKWEITVGKAKKQVSLDAEKLTIKEKSDARPGSWQRTPGH